MSIAAVASSHLPAQAELPPLALPIVGLLEQLRDVLTLLPSSLYVARPAARVSGSVGEHVRHCLDHIAALTSAVESGELSYDRRLRGTMTETDPVTAVNEIERLFTRFERLPEHVLDRSVRLSVLTDKSLPPLVVRSTVARELAFVLQHTIHHCALIAVLLDCQGWRVPCGFGVAPSTARARMAVG
jgi:hypothetical protein